MEPMDKLISKRKYVRGAVTKLINKSKTLLEESDPDYETLLEKLSLLEEKQKELKTLDANIESLITNSAAFDTEIASSIEYDEDLSSMKIRIKNRIKLMKKEDNTEDSKLNESLSANNSTTVPGISSNLPKLAIPNFSGDSHLFLDFYNCFLTIIDSNNSLTKVEKFIYLKSYLSGEAYQIVAGFALTEENYSSCLNLLKERYGKSERIISVYMNKLLEMEPVKQSSNLKGLRKLYDESEVSIRNLNSLGVTSDNYGHLLIPLILKQLPPDLVVEYHRKRDPKYGGDVKHLIKFLKSEIESREAAQLVTSANTKPENTRFKQQFQPHKVRVNHPTAAALNTTYTKTFCIFCDSNAHTGYKCKIFSDEQKRFKLKKEGRCYKCFCKNHMVYQCKVKIQPCENCQSLKHNLLFCPEVKNKTVTETKKSEDNVSELPEKQTVVSSILNSQNKSSKDFTTLLQTCNVFALNGPHKLGTKLLYDSGSQKSFIRKDLATKLGLEPFDKEAVLIYTFSDPKPKEVVYDLVNVTLQSRISPFKRISIPAFVSDEITCAQIHSNVNFEFIENIRSEGFELADSFDNTPVQVLLGADYMFGTLIGPMNKISRNLYLQSSFFGFLLCGQLESFKSCTNVSVNLVCTETCSDLRKLWDTEHFLLSSENETVVESCLLKTFESQLERVNGRYSAPLLWVDDQSRDLLPNNHDLAKKRFASLQRRLERDESLFYKYNTIIKEQLQDGIIEVCGDADIGYVMPHHEVYRSSSTTSQVRIVYDASSKQGDLKSLNDCLNSGDNLYPNLTNMIIKFREHKIAFCADVARAFLQIEVPVKDRKYLCFIYFKNCDKNEPLILYRFTRHCFGVTCSPFVLAATIKCHIKKLENLNPLAFQMLNNNLYVDDLFFGSESIEQAYKLSEDALLILKDAKMNLRKFETNCNELKSLWGQSDFSFEMRANLDSISKLLGLAWSPTDDSLSFDLKSILSQLDDTQCTKRYVLHTAAKIFDPAGFITPFLIRIKCLLQELWIAGVEWDERFSEELKPKWVNWCSEIHQLEDLKIPRFYFIDLIATNKVIQLHVFSDSSIKSYGAVAYFRYQTSEGSYQTRLVMSKSRVAPIKKVTLPRLELMGAVIAARIASNLVKTFPLLSSINFWCDSTIVLHWIKGSASKWKQFVSNRIIEIQQLTNPMSWRHCSGKDNPADLLTRGCSAGVLSTSSKWWYGPSWLTEPQCTWPTENPLNSEYLQIEPEAESEYRSSAIVSTTTCLEPILDIGKFSCMNKLRRVLAWVLRFVGKIKGACKEKGPLSTIELENAEEHLIKMAQNQVYSNEINNLKIGKPLPKDSKLLCLNPFLDDKGILRVKGRLSKSNFPDYIKFPIIIPRKSKLEELLIWEAHKRVLHSSVSHTLSQIREKYWLIKCRQTIKSVLQKCVVCKRFNASAGDQSVAPLPADRVDQSPAFTVVGIDYAGPLYCKNIEGKLYILLITCAVTRALHLELVGNLSTETFLLAFRRFIARRGLCSVVYSDNARTFKKADNELKLIWTVMNDDHVKDFYSSAGIKWKYIVEKAAWWGGFYERMVRTVKTALRKAVGKSSLKFDELQTLLFEIEAMINSRPITYVSDDPNDPQALTPAHFLLGKTVTCLPPSKLLIEGASSRKILIKAFNYREKLLNSFWKRWYNEYLLNLKSVYVNLPKTKLNEFKVNDIVLIKDDFLPRNFWKLGRILEVYPGRDGKIRACLLKTQTTTLRRPVQLLFNLEVPE